MEVDILYLWFDTRKFGTNRVRTLLKNLNIKPTGRGGTTESGWTRYPMKDRSGIRYKKKEILKISDRFNIEIGIR